MDINAVLINSLDLYAEGRDCLTDEQTDERTWRWLQLVRCPVIYRQRNEFRQHVADMLSSNSMIQQVRRPVRLDPLSTLQQEHNGL